MVGGSRGESEAGTAWTDTGGAFSFTGLRASEYVLEVLDEDEVVASASVSLAEGDMQASGITLSEGSEIPDDRSWVSRHKTATILIAVGAVLGTVAYLCTANTCDE